MACGKCKKTTRLACPCNAYRSGAGLRLRMSTLSPVPSFERRIASYVKVHSCYTPKVIDVVSTIGKSIRAFCMPYESRQWRDQRAARWKSRVNVQ